MAKIIYAVNIPDPDPDPGAIPDTEQVDALLHVLDEGSLPLFVVVLVDVIHVDIDERKIRAHVVNDLVQDAQVLQDRSIQSFFGH